MCVFKRVCVCVGINVCMLACVFHPDPPGAEWWGGWVVQGGGEGGFVGGVGGRHCPNDAFSTPLIQWLCSPVNPSHATH